MKKTIVFLAALFTIVGSTMAEELKIADLSIGKGNTALCQVEFSNTGKYSGFSFKMVLPEGVSFAKDDSDNYLSSLGERFSGTTFSLMSLLNPDGAVGFSTMGSQAFPGTSGSIVDIFLVADESLEVGKELTATVKDIEFTNTSLEAVKFDDFTFKITITEHVSEYTVLDETSTTVPDASEGPVKINVKRTIKAGEWSTICLPFAMTGEQVTTAFGSDVALKDFVNYEVQEDAAENIIGLTVNFEDKDVAEGMEVNYPYLIKTSSDISEFTVESTLEPVEEDCVVEYDNGKSGSRRVVYGSLIGTLHANITVPSNSLFINGNKFWYSTGATKMKAFRAYFKFVDILTDVENANAKISINFIEGTGIKGVYETPSTNKVYTVNGIEVNDNGNLPKGIYIINGKKIVK